MKNILSLELSMRAGTKGRPWFVQKASRKRVSNRDHFEYLMNTYIPKKHGGWRWTELLGWMSPKSKQGRIKVPIGNLPTSPAREGRVSEHPTKRSASTIHWDLDKELNLLVE